MRKSLQISHRGEAGMCRGEQWGKPAPWQASSWQKGRTWVPPGPPLLGRTGSLVMGALGGEHTACLGGDSAMPSAVVPPATPSGARTGLGGRDPPWH